MVAKRAQHVAPNNVALTCCDRLAGALVLTVVLTTEIKLRFQIPSA